MEQKNYELHFAPLQGYTDTVFRNAFAEHFGAVDAYYTPFIRAERGEVRKRDLREAAPEANRVPCLVPQILPGSPEEFRMLADVLRAQGYRRIDINLGCPFPPIAGKRKGAGMLPYPDRVEEVLRTVSEYPDLQFSVKMRLGWEDAGECLNLAAILNGLRLAHITLHARTGKQQYKGIADREAFDRFYRLCRQPLFYNGDLQTAADIRGILEEFPALQGVSVGRGLVASPTLAGEFRSESPCSEKERTERCFSFHQTLFDAYAALLQGEAQTLMKMKTLWEYFLPETDRKLLKRIKKSTRLEQYTAAVREIFRGC